MGTGKGKARRAQARGTAGPQTSEPTINEYGDKEWRNAAGELHRVDGPAVEWANGDNDWYANGERHRTDGPAIECAEGKEWWVDGKLHRADGPAIDYVDGIKEWYVNGELHREDGPAMEWVNGYKAWWVNDVELTEEEFDERANKAAREAEVAREAVRDEVMTNSDYRNPFGRDH